MTMHVNHPLTSVRYPAIKQLLLSRLQAALGLYVPDGSVLNHGAQDISLHRAKDCRRVLYISGLALQLEKAQKIPALKIATALAKLVVDISTLIRPGSSLTAVDDRDFTVQVVPPGWIHLELTEPAIAAWLQRLVLFPCHEVFPARKSSLLERAPSHTSRLFAVQYAHARCCSLVQLAHREKLITLSDASPAVFRAIAPDPIPWLNDQKLRFCHPTEHVLIAQLLGLLDDLYCPWEEGKLIDWEKAALNLSQDFQNFYRSSRIWGEVKIQTPHLAQARLGLVMATQTVLRLILQDRLGVCAPLEL